MTIRNLAPLAWYLAACASGPQPAAKGGPRGLHASEHLDVAREHEELARRQSSYPDVRSSASDPTSVPWVVVWEPAVDHERIAKVHRSEAAAIQAEFAAACGPDASTAIGMSPLQRYGLGGQNTANGVTLYLSAEAGPPWRLLKDLQCHRAWMMLAPADMENCPLDLPSLQIRASGSASGIVVELTARDSRYIGELQHRAAKDLETARSLQRAE